MAVIGSFRQLRVWQRAMTLVEHCYVLVRRFPESERYALSAQIRRAAISIPSNISEGFNRRSRAAYVNHLSIALGSQAELETQLELAVRLGFVRERDARGATELIDHIGRELHNLIKVLEQESGRSSAQRRVPSADT